MYQTPCQTLGYRNEQRDKVPNPRVIITATTRREVPKTDTYMRLGRRSSLVMIREGFINKIDSIIDILKQELGR